MWGFARLVGLGYGVDGEKMDYDCGDHGDDGDVIMLH
jgi:hypothetical protein